MIKYEIKYNDLDLYKIAQKYFLNKNLDFLGFFAKFQLVRNLKVWCCTQTVVLCLV